MIEGLLGYRPRGDLKGIWTNVSPDFVRYDDELDRVIEGATWGLPTTSTPHVSAWTLPPTKRPTRYYILERGDIYMCSICIGL